MSFASVINCFDGRVQIPVINYLLDRFEVSYVDVVTANGPDGIMARQEDLTCVASILEMIAESVHRHGSQGIALVGHYDCAGNQVDSATHHAHIRSGVDFLAKNFPEQEVIGLWLASQWKVDEICQVGPQSLASAEGETGGA